MSINLETMMSGVTTAIAMLVHELDKRGSMSKSEFAQLLRDAANAAESQAPAEIKDIPRGDLAVMRKIADLVAQPPAEWTPVVIQGGLPPDDSKSD